VLPHERRDGFWANIRGHVLDLAKPGSDESAAPTPNDLYAASVAAELAWSVRDALRGAGAPDDVSVSAEWQAEPDPPLLSQLTLTVTVPKPAEALAAELAASFGERLAARSSAAPIVHWRSL
jgi:hypothetical protein